ncbi:hypothetical protein PIB30_105944, partial [Stylosanthes scabra]|nr:hypothetical protein [Stylosanthes scabra]
MEEIDRWSNIGQDLFEEISKRFFSYNEYIQLRLVCKEWSLKLPKIHSKTPWLLLPEETFKNHCYEDEEIYQLMQLPVADDEALDADALEEEEIYHMMLPDMQKQNILIRGSGHGWLVMVSISDGTMQMLNPFTNVSLDLPPISTFPNVIDYQPDNHGNEYTLWDFRDKTGGNLRSDSLHRIQVFKVVINSSPHNNENFMAVAIFGSCNRLAKYKEFEDVIFFEEKIYTVNNDGYVYEFSSKTKALLRRAGPPSEVPVGPYALKHLIGCGNGSLLMLVRHVGPPLGGKSKDYKTSKLDIYELKRNAKEWSKLDNLDNLLDVKSSFEHVVAQDIGIFELGW